MSKQKTAAGSGSKRKNGRIRNKLLIFIMPVVLAALLILVVLASVNSKAIMTNMAEEQLHSSIVNQQSSIEAWLDKNMEFFSSVKHTIEAENPSDAELQSILDAYYGYNKYVPDGLYIR